MLDFSDIKNFSLRREQTDIIVNECVKDEENIKALTEIINDKNKQASSKAAYYLVCSYKMNPDLVRPYLDNIFNTLMSTPHSNTRARTLQIMSMEPLREKYIDMLTEKCFEWLTGSFEDVCTKVFSMEILYSVAKLYPEIGNELKQVLLERFEFEGGGFLSRGRKIVKRIDKLLK